MANPNCILCISAESTHSLPLKKEAGVWVTTPICKKCKRSLEREAAAAGKSILIYGLDGSLKEAERRNSVDAQVKSLVKTYAVSKKMDKIESYLRLARKG